MRILVTNDDGIASPGLHQLATHLTGLGHDVIVVAPNVDVSGCGTGVGRARPDQRPDSVESDLGTTGLRGFAIQGTPGLAVMAAVFGRFGDVPDIVVSGINAGINCGHVVLHSGTVGGALTAQTFGVPGLAVSLQAGESWRWSDAAEVAGSLIPWVVAMPRALAVNVNVPNLPFEKHAGIRLARLDTRGTFRIASIESSGLDFEVHWPTDQPEPDSDVALLRQGFVTVTPLTALSHADEPLPALPEM
jgi:5'-nucleotidase